MHAYMVAEEIKSDLRYRISKRVVMQLNKGEKLAQQMRVGAEDGACL